MQYRIPNILNVPSPALWPRSVGSATSGGVIDDTMRNLVINGDFRIDQRNEGALVTSAANSGKIKSVDKWFAQNTTAGAGAFTMQRVPILSVQADFTNQFQVICTVADSAPAAASLYYIGTNIEGFLCQPLGWNAAFTTYGVWLSFNFAGLAPGGIYNFALQNSAQTRSYVGTFNSGGGIGKVSVLIPADTAGTWLFNNGVGVRLIFDMGSGSNFSSGITTNAWSAGNFTCSTGTSRLVQTIGDTFLIAGVQLEPNYFGVATVFEYVRYEVQLAECQRYYEKTFANGTVPAQALGINRGSDTNIAGVAAGVSTSVISCRYKVPKCAVNATITLFNPFSANAQARDQTNNVDCSATVATAFANSDVSFLVVTTGNAATTINSFLSIMWTADADL